MTIFVCKLWLIFVEREENVKADIFHAYITLLKQTKPSTIQDPDSMELEEGYFFIAVLLVCLLLGSHSVSVRAFCFGCCICRLCVCPTLDLDKKAW